MECGLYIHIPFCAYKCDYCDFYSLPGVPAAGLDRYLAWLRGEIEHQLALYNVHAVPSVYIGGGTPSYLGAARLGSLLSFLGKTLPAGPRELTVEVNPESLHDDIIAACLDGAVTRLSVGVQTFHEPSLTAIGRRGPKGADAVRQRLDTLAQAPFDLSLDFMTGLPFQSEATIRSDIEAAISYRSAHISLYDLMLEERTPLARRVSVGAVALPERETADALWITGRDMLEEAGYAQYEVSNFARPGKRSAHNIRYWRMLNWLGCGTGASGTLINDDAGNGVRITDGKREYLDRAALMRETLLMGFRYIDGPDPRLFQRRFGIRLEEAIPAALERWRNAKLARTDAAALTPDGLLLLNRFLTSCFTELED